MRDARPVFLFFFANADVGTEEHLRGLAPELDRLRRHGQGMLEATGVEPRFEPDATRDHLIRLLTDPDLSERIVGVHFAGHAGPDRWMMRAEEAHAADAEAGSAAAHAAGVLQMLGALPALRLVVLNGCSTGEQAGTLLASGVPAVIATDHAIADDAALIFSDWLYQGLVRGVSVQQAFDHAREAVRTHRGEAPTDLWRMVRRAGTKKKGPSLPWQLTLSPDEPERAGGWRLADALDDPLAGLPAVPPAPLPASPYRHVQRFSGADAEIFFGRGPEIRRLYRLITEPDTPHLILLFGESGVGKSSLLEAGLTPRLAAAGYRVELRRRDPSTGLRGALRACLGLAAGGSGPIDWKAAEARGGGPIVAIVDQVEEALLDGEGDGGLGALLDAAVAIFETGTPPAGKLVLGFRKAYLAELGAALERRGLTASRAYVRPLDRNAVIEVVEGPTGSRRLRAHFQLELEDGLAERIADDLTAGEPAAVAPILQMLLSRMWDAQNDPPVIFDSAAYDRARRSGVELVEIFEKQLAAAEARGGSDGLLLDLLEFHTTRQGTAAAHTVDGLTARYPHVELEPLVQTAIDQRLLSRWTGERDARGGTRLAHDMWGPMVVDAFHRSSRPGQRARRLLEVQARDWTAEQRTLADDPREEIQRRLEAMQSSAEREAKLLSVGALAEVERGLPSMRRPTEQEAAFLAASRKARAARMHRTRRDRLLMVGGVLVTLVLIGIVGMLRSTLDEQAAAREDIVAEKHQMANTLVDSSWLTEAQEHVHDASLAAAALGAVSDHTLPGWSETARAILSKPIARDWLPARRLIGFDPKGRLVVLDDEGIARIDPDTGARTVEPPPPWSDAPLALDAQGRVVALVPADAPAAAVAGDAPPTDGDPLADAERMELRTADGTRVGEPFRCPQPKPRRVDSPRWLFAATCAGEPKLIDRHGRTIDFPAPPAAPEGLAELITGRSSRVADVNPWRPALILCTTLELQPPWPALSGTERLYRHGEQVTRVWQTDPLDRALGPFCPTLAFNADDTTGAVLLSDGLYRFQFTPRSPGDPDLTIRFEPVITQPVPATVERPSMRFVDPHRVAIDVPDGAVALVDTRDGRLIELATSVAFPGSADDDPLAARMVVDDTGRWLAELRLGAVRLWSLAPLEPAPADATAAALHDRLVAATRGCPFPDSFARVMRQPSSMGLELWRRCTHGDVSRVGSSWLRPWDMFLHTTR